MKKVILIASFFVFAIITSQAQTQSTPPPFAPKVGTIFLRSTTETFSEVIKLNVPDTLRMYTPFNATFKTDSMSIDTVTGLPSSCSWTTSCGSKKNCTFLPLTSNDITINHFGNITAGTYTITITSTLYCNTPFGISPQPTDFKYYLEIYPSIQRHNLITTYQTDSSSTSGNLCNGSAKINASKGTAPYSYKWDSGELIDSISGKCANNYTVIVSDNSGIKDTLIIAIADSTTGSISNPNPNPSSGPGPVTCDTCTTGLTTFIATQNELFVQDIPLMFDSSSFNGLGIDSIAITAVDSLPKGISWKTDCGTNTPCKYFKAGNYVLNLTGASTEVGTDTIALRMLLYSKLSADSTGIPFDQRYVIYTFPQSNAHTLISSYTSNNVSMFKMCDGSANIIATKGSAPYTYKWSSGETSNKIFGKCSNKYTVNVSDSQGLKDSLDIYISEPTDTILQQQPVTFIPIDTIITNYDTCIVDYNIPIDSAFATTFTMLDSTHLSMDYEIYQGGKKIVFNALFSFDTIGVIAFDLALNCKGTFTKMLKSTVISQVVNLQYDQIGKTQTIAQNNLTSIAEPLNKNQSVFIYPNPFSSQTTITLSKEMNSASINVIDVFGRTVKTLKLSGTQVILERGDLSAGIYFLQILNNGIVFISKKVIIQ